MVNGWVVLYKDGHTVTEEDILWQDVIKSQIARLSLRWFDREYHIDGPQQGWIQFKSAYQDMGAETVVTSRVIGYYQDQLKIYYRVDEQTGDLAIERH